MGESPPSLNSFGAHTHAGSPNTFRDEWPPVERAVELREQRRRAFRLRMLAQGYVPLELVDDAGGIGEGALG